MGKIKDINGEYNVDHFQFFNITNPIVAYTLGLIWADGTISKNGYSISIDCKYDDKLDSDYNTIKNIINKIGSWNEYIRTRHDKRTDKYYHSCSFSTSNKYLVKFLNKMDYSNKSSVSPDKILNHIPIELQHHFIRGYFDGDGSLFVKGNTYTLCISSSYDYNWDFMIDLGLSLGVEYYNVRNYIHKTKNSRSSSYNIQNKICISKLCDWMYIDSNDLRFDRKYQKYLIIKSKNNKRLIKNNWTDDELIFLKENYNMDNVDFCSIKLNRTKNSIKCKAQELNLSTHNSEWTDSDINFIKENYKKGHKYCSEILNKSKSSTSHKIRKINSELLHNKKWSTSDKDFLIKNYKKHGIKYCSDILKRTTISMESMACKLNITKKQICKKWTDTEIEFLLDNYSKGSKYCIIKLNRSRSSVITKYIRLNKTKQNKTNNIISTKIDKKIINY